MVTQYLKFARHIDGHKYKRLLSFLNISMKNLKNSITNIILESAFSGPYNERERKGLKQSHWETYFSSESAE